MQPQEDFFSQFNNPSGGGTGTLPPIKTNYLNGPPRTSSVPRQTGQQGFLSHVVGGLTQVPKYFGNNVINSVKQAAGDVTGNVVAANNAAKAERHNLVGANANNAGGALKTLVGNTAQLGSMVVAPELKGTGILGKVVQGAKTGAVAGGGSALANNQDLTKGAITGAATGGALNGILSKVLRTGNPMKPTPGMVNSEQLTAAKQAAGLKNPVAAAGKQAQKYGTDLLGNKLNITPADATKFNGPETVARLQREHGLTVNQAADLHPVITGGEGVTTQAMDSALQNMGNVNFKNFATQMKNHIGDPEYQAANLPDGLSSAQGKNLQAVIDKYHVALNPPSEAPLTKSSTGAVIDNGTNAKSAMDIAKNLEKQGYANQASSSPNKQALSDLQLKMADTIKSHIFNAPGGDQALEAAKTDAVGNLHAYSQLSGNTKLDSVAKAVSEAKTFPEFRNVSAPFVNARQLVSKSNINDFANAGRDTGRGGVFSTAKNAVSKVVSPVGGKILSNVGNKIEDNTNAASEATAGVPLADNKTSFLQKFLSNPQAVMAGSQAAVTGASAAAGNPPAQGGQQGQPSAIDTTGVSDMINSLPGASTDTTQPTTASAFSPANIQAAILQDIAENGGKNVSTLVSMYNTFGKPSAAATKLSTTEQNSTDALHSALATLGTYNDQLNAAGGGRGVAGGTAENVLGKFGIGGSTAANVRAIESQKTDVATSIAKALTGGKPSSAQIKSWEDAIPNVTDSPAVAKQKMANITASIQSKLQTLAPAQ